MDLLWLRILKKHYSNIYESASAKSIANLSWQQLYRSLRLWRELDHAAITIDEFSIARNYSERNLDFQVIRNGIIGVLKNNGVVYYNIATLQQLPELNIIENFNCIKYSENDDIILLLDSRHTLFLKRKENRSKIEAVFYRVELFLILGDVFYYVTFENFIYKCVFVDGAYESIYLVRTKPVIALGHENGVFYYMARDGDQVTIFSLPNDKLKVLFVNAPIVLQFEALKKYNFANNMHWTRFYNNDRDINQKYPQAKNIHLIRTHGPVLFAGYNPGILCIFHSQYYKYVVDALKSKPLKFYLVVEPNKGIMNCQILNIDAVEGEYSHTVLVALSHKILAIKFNHPRPNWDMGRSSDRCSSGSKGSTCNETESATEDQPMDIEEAPTASVQQPTVITELRCSTGIPSTSSEELSCCGEPSAKIAKKSH